MTSSSEKPQICIDRFLNIKDNIEASLERLRMKTDAQVVTHNCFLGQIIQDSLVLYKCLYCKRLYCNRVLISWRRQLASMIVYCGLVRLEIKHKAGNQITIHFIESS